MSRKTARYAVIIAALVLILTVATFGAVACGEAGDGTDTTSLPSDGTISHPDGTNELVLRVSSAGGLVPVSAAITRIPEFSLYGDGTVIVTGPVIEIYPGPAMPNLQTATMPEESMQAILSATHEIGLFTSDVDYGRPDITDMQTTTITINANGTTYRSEIYALGSEQGAAGLSLEQQQARAAVAGLIGRLQDPTEFHVGDLQWAPYEYQALAVFSVLVDPGYSPQPGDVQPNYLDWPLDDLANSGSPAGTGDFRKTVVSGDGLASLQPLLKEATQITVWRSGGHEYNLYFRPLLPDETV